MSKRILVISILMLASFFVSCSKDQDQRQSQQQAVVTAPKVEAIVKVEPFNAPASPVISEDKAKMYVKASAALLELGVSWTDRIEKAQDNEKVQILNAYNVARDQLCARVGLAGIAEYNWLTEVALKEEGNKATFEAAGMKIQ
ncbi:MAG: hypothetical protein II892_00380 [Fibrobacter sp.]|jgi:hypothetical protein|nr:hypothetical protein [Fibrobacter sp.]MBQ3778456.1 hypothetical protein [Fibrobacter sp.]